MRKDVKMLVNQKNLTAKERGRSGEKRKPLLRKIGRDGFPLMRGFFR